MHQFVLEVVGEEQHIVSECKNTLPCREKVNSRVLEMVIKVAPEMHNKQEALTISIRYKTKIHTS
jgi:hypothetical protein